MDAETIEQIKAGLEYERTRNGPPESFPKLPDIPGSRYVDPEFLALEWRYLWKKAWLYACHIDELPEPGSYILWKKTQAPIIILRDRDDTVRAFYNTCRHRGGPLVKEERGTVRGFTCGYHGWTYDLEGRLINLRDKRDFVGLDTACRSLVPVRCERLGNWIFINEDPDAEPLIEHLGPIADEFRQFQPENTRLVHSEGFDVACNVKVLLDAFLEVYHLKSIHQNTVDRFLDHRGTTITLWPKGHSRMVTPNRRPDWVDPGARDMPEIPTVTEIPRTANVSYNFYPNLVCPPAPSGMPFLTFWPTGPRSMRIECHWFAPDIDDAPNHERWPERIANFDRILAEDTQFAPQIQESVESPGFLGMPLNYQERRIYHWHEELDRRIGRERVPAGARVEPVLEPFSETGRRDG